MADELQFYGDPQADTALTVTCKVYDSTGTQVGDDVACTEVGSIAIYLGDMPSAGAGKYVLRFFDGANMLSQAEFLWDGTQEIVSGLTDIDGYLEIEAQRIMLSVLAGKVRGAQTGTETFRDASDVKDRVIAQVDSNGNRNNIVLDAT